MGKDYHSLVFVSFMSLRIDTGIIKNKNKTYAEKQTLLQLGRNVKKEEVEKYVSIVL